MDRNLKEKIYTNTVETVKHLALEIAIIKYKYDDLTELSDVSDYEIESLQTALDSLVAKLVEKDVDFVSEYELDRTANFYKGVTYWFDGKTVHVTFNGAGVKEFYLTPEKIYRIPDATVQYKENGKNHFKKIGIIDKIYYDFDDKFDNINCYTIYHNDNIYIIKDDKILTGDAVDADADRILINNLTEREFTAKEKLIGKAVIKESWGTISIDLNNYDNYQIVEYEK